jgi:hypothetical protein
MVRVNTYINYPTSYLGRQLGSRRVASRWEVGYTYLHTYCIYIFTLY